MTGEIVDTERLHLRPNDPRWQLALIESVESFEEISGLRASEGLRGFLVSGEVSEDYLTTLRTAADPDPWMHGFAVILRESDQMIGMGGFKGPPDADGVAEIAYGIAPAYEGRGYATEAADALARVASADPRVRLLRAHTLPQPNASNRILTKIGFTFAGEVVDPDDGPVWRWERQPLPR
jgi:ribosomal-protein-alanine N-acetyltransferase